MQRCQGREAAIARGHRPSSLRLERSVTSWSLFSRPRPLRSFVRLSLTVQFWTVRFNRSLEGRGYWRSCCSSARGAFYLVLHSLWALVMVTASRWSTDHFGPHRWRLLAIKGCQMAKNSRHCLCGLVSESRMVNYGTSKERGVSQYHSSLDKLLRSPGRETPSSRNASSLEAIYVL